MYGSAAMLAAPLSAEAQQGKKVPRLCFLIFDPGTFETRSSRWESFFQRLAELGYVPGRTIVIDYLSAGGRHERFSELAEECLRRKADVIAVTTTPGGHAAKKATQTTPIVMLSLGDPVGTGLVASIARPEGNLTGATMMTSDLAGKRLELLQQAVPKLTRVLVLSNLADPIAPLQVKVLESAAPSLGVTLQIRDIRTGDDLPAAFDAGVKDGVNGLLVTGESIFVVNRARLTELATRHKLPAIYPWSLLVTDASGLMAYDSNEPDLHRHAADYVDRILKGAKPSELPIHRPTNVQLVISLKAARAIGLTVPPALLVRANQVIE
jgi:putative tryptophan/tyrosine transport system substrate-binding protein